MRIEGIVKSLIGHYEEASSQTKLYSILIIIVQSNKVA